MPYYKIQTDHRPLRRKKMPLIRALKVGESFLVPLAEESSLRSSANWFNVTQHEARVTVRKERDGVRCIRLW
jgi:hypothetical protein